ncbi:MAG: type III secretion system chaperone [Chlamydiota bacterium]
MVLEDYVRMIWGELEIAGKPAAAAQGAYSIPVDEGLEVVVDEIPQHGYHLFSKVSDLPEGGDRESFYINAMRANLFGQGTGGGALGLDHEAHSLVLSQLLEGDASYSDFRDVIEDFINWVEFWQGEVQRELAPKKHPFG